MKILLDKQANCDDLEESIKIYRDESAVGTIFVVALNTISISKKGDHEDRPYITYFLLEKILFLSFLQNLQNT